MKECENSPSWYICSDAITGTRPAWKAGVRKRIAGSNPARCAICSHLTNWNRWPPSQGGDAGSSPAGSTNRRRLVPAFSGKESRDIRHGSWAGISGWSLPSYYHTAPCGRGTRKYASVAQMVERQVEALRCGGSIPSWGTICSRSSDGRAFDR